MLIVAGKFEVDPDQREAFLAGRMEAMLITREESGCLDYAMSADPIESDRVLLFERWTDQASLDAHLVRARSVPRPEGEVLPTATVVSFYDVEAQRTPGG